MKYIIKGKRQDHILGKIYHGKVSIINKKAIKKKILEKGYILIKSKENGY